MRLKYYNWNTQAVYKGQNLSVPSEYRDEGKRRRGDVDVGLGAHTTLAS